MRRLSFDGNESLGKKFGGALAYFSHSAASKSAISGAKTAGVVSLAMLTALPAIAEEADNSYGLEEVVVTARKTQESAQDIPIAITAISAQLTNSTIRDLRDLNGFAPNVQISEDGSRGGGGANITIRGISPTRSDDNSFDSPIGVMIDGIYLGSLAGQVLENFDLERVEVLRGPQGTLFGKNTVGGVINVIRSRPTGELGGKFRLTGGRYGQREFRGVVNTPVVEDVLAAKAFVTVQKDDGFMKNDTTGNKVGNRDYMNYGLTLLATPGDRFEATLTAERFKDDSKLGAFQTNYNVAPGVLPVPTDPNDTDYSGGFLNCALFPQTCRTSEDRPRRSQNDTDNRAELDTKALTLNMSLDLNDNMTLHSITGYRDMDEYRIYDFDASSAPFITIERWNEYDQFSEELFIEGKWDNFNFTAGAYFWNSEFEQDWVTGGQFWATLFGAVATDPAAWGACQAGALAPVFCDTGVAGGVPAGQDVTQILFETQETESIAFFTQGDWMINEKWTLTAGIRWTEETKDFVAGQAYLSNVARQRERNFPEFADLKNKWTDVSPKVGLTYQIADDAILYASYSEGFHSGGFFGVNQNTRDFVRDQYNPERAQSYEVGFKSQWMDNRLRLNMTAFRNDFEDKQESSVQVDPDTQTVATVFDNVADAVYQGFELETEFVFNENFRAFVNYGFLDAEYRDFFTDINAADGVTIIEEASFLAPRNAPKHTVGVGAFYTQQLGPGELEVYAKYSYVDDVETDLLNAPQGRLQGVDDVTASIGYFGETYSVQLFGRNLTDQRTETFIPIATLFAAGTVNRPRSYGLEVTFQMGGN